MVLLDFIGIALIQMVPTELQSENRNRLDTQGHYACQAAIAHAKSWITYVQSPGDLTGLNPTDITSPGKLINLGDSGWNNTLGPHFSLVNDIMSCPTNNDEFYVCQLSGLSIPPSPYSTQVIKPSYIVTGAAGLGYQTGDVDANTYVVTSKRPVVIGDWKIYTTMVPSVNTPGGINNQASIGTVAGASGNRCYQVVSIAYCQGVPKLRAKCTLLEDSFARFARMWGSQDQLASDGVTDCSLTLNVPNKAFVKGPIHTNAYFRLNINPTMWTTTTNAAFQGTMTYASAPPPSEVPSTLNFDNVAYLGGNDSGLVGFGGTSTNLRPFDNAGATITSANGYDRYQQLIANGKSNLLATSAITLPASTGSISTAAFGSNQVPVVGSQVVPGQGTNGLFLATTTAGAAAGGVYIRGNLNQMVLGLVDSGGNPITNATDLANASNTAANANPVIRAQMSTGVTSMTTSYSTTFSTTTSVASLTPTATSYSTSTGTVATSTTYSTTYTTTTTRVTATQHGSSATTTTYSTTTGTSVSTTYTTSTTYGKSTTVASAVTGTQSAGQGGGSILQWGYTTTTATTSTNVSTTTNRATSYLTGSTTKATTVSVPTGTTVTTSTSTQQNISGMSTAYGNTTSTSSSVSYLTNYTTSTGSSVSNTVATSTYRPIDQVVKTDATSLTINPATNWVGAVTASSLVTSTAATAWDGSTKEDSTLYGKGWSRPPGAGDAANDVASGTVTNGSSGSGSIVQMTGITATAVYVNGALLTAATTFSTGQAVLIKQSRTDPKRLDVFVAARATDASTTLNGAIFSENNIFNLNGWVEGRNTIAVGYPLTGTATAALATATSYIGSTTTNYVGVADNIYQVGTYPGQTPLTAKNGLGIVAPYVNIVARQSTNTGVKEFNTNLSNSDTLLSRSTLTIYAVILAGTSGNAGGIEANFGHLLNGTNPWTGIPAWTSGQPPSLQFVGGTIESKQQERGFYSTGQSGKVGWADNFIYDQQLANAPPPFFPTTGAMIPMSYEEERLAW